MEGEGGGGEGGREIGHDRVYKSQTDYFFLLFFVGTIERFSEDSLTEGAQEQVSRTRAHTHRWTQWQEVAYGRERRHTTSSSSVAFLLCTLCL
jgi:hypothetical protein